MKSTRCACTSETKDIDGRPMLVMNICAACSDRMLADVMRDLGTPDGLRAAWDTKSDPRVRESHRVISGSELDRMRQTLATPDVPNLQSFTLTDDGECDRCSTPCDRIVRITLLDGAEFPHVLCEGCEALFKSKLEARRQQFEFLVSNGVSRERANEIMISRIDREDA
jgi:hypothetical protein